MKTMADLQQSFSLLDASFQRVSSALSTTPTSELGDFSRRSSIALTDLQREIGLLLAPVENDLLPLFDNARLSAPEITARVKMHGALGISVLVRALGQKDPVLRERAAIVLAWCRADAAAAIPALVKNLAADKKPALQEASVMALGAIGIAGPGVVPALAAAVERGHYDVRAHAVKALGALGPAAHEALPVLRAAYLPRNFVAANSQLDLAIAKIEGCDAANVALRRSNN